MDPARLRYFDAPEVCQATAEILTGFLAPEDDATSRWFADWDEPLASAAPSSDGLRREIFYLRAFTIDFAITLTLGDSQAKRSVLDSFYQRLTESGGLDQSYLEHAAAYATAVNERHHNGPAWSIGKRFATFVGAPSDLECVMAGASQFTALSQAISEMVEQVTRQ